MTQPASQKPEPTPSLPPEIRKLIASIIIEEACLEYAKQTAGQIGQLKAQLAFYESASEIITTDKGRVWIAAEKHEAVVDRLREALEEILVIRLTKDDEATNRSRFEKACDIASEALAATPKPNVRPKRNHHWGDCTFYSSLINQSPTDGICVCGYGWSVFADSGGVDQSKLYSAERLEAMKSKK